MHPPLPSVIFDLDGTITDSRPGIVACLARILDERGIAHNGPLERFVGPPVEEWTAELLPHAGDEARMEVVRDYRALYGREGWNNNSVYPGVRELLAALNEKGFPLYICTSKHEPSALRVLDHFGLAGLFTAVFADRPDMESHGKTDLLASLLGRQSIDRANAWMVGDRIYDFEAARANGIRSIAAAWGYGSAQEYSQADAVAVTPEQVLELVAPAERNPAVSIFR